MLELLGHACISTLFYISFNIVKPQYPLGVSSGNREVSMYTDQKKKCGNKPKPQEEFKSVIAEDDRAWSMGSVATELCTEELRRTAMYFRIQT
jgi:hypothetical protein